MKITYRSVCIILSLMMMYGCGQLSPQVYSVSFITLNHTDKKFTEVTMRGKGYPGSVGNCVAGSMSAMVFSVDSLGSDVEIFWRDSQGVLQERLFTFGQNVVMSENMHVFLKFSHAGDVEFAISRPDSGTSALRDIAPDSEYATVVEKPALSIEE